MTRRADWDFALRIRGVSLSTLQLGRLAEYLGRFADLLGDDGRPVFAGVVKGSVVLRVKERNTRLVSTTRQRLRKAANDDEAPGRSAYERLTSLLRSDGARGAVVDEKNDEVIVFPSLPQPSISAEVVVADVADIDGVVVAVEGVDDTAHIRLLDPSTKAITSVQVRDMALARQAAACFRGAALRIRVHGTWKRTPEGNWVPNSLYADAIEQLDQRSAVEVFGDLGAIRHTGWANMSKEDASKLLDDIRGRE
ncbi:hypothetical protein HLB44_16875 [Aquincola sp. S2]|uniref:Uncharacterized protein n=1 Tax=Pseudaquabacterium terrae TaxID=2732868 RepID=A0ABX2EJ89_9BURK|nr:hypothetical protein [Aquabacterium terrae]NRF68668.1 hypothetical protein [Aquabacterium terrae]